MGEKINAKSNPTIIEIRIGFNKKKHNIRRKPNKTVTPVFLK